jgi:tetratricopeptide (TPR) repeat protein
MLLRLRNAATLLARKAHILSTKMHAHKEALAMLLRAAKDCYCDVDDVYASIARLYEHRLGNYAEAQRYYSMTSVDLALYHRFMLSHRPEDKAAIRSVRSRVWGSPLSSELNQAIIAEDIEYNMNAAHFNYQTALLDNSNLTLDRAFVHFSFGRFLWQKRKNHSQARAEFEAALSLDPLYCECHLLLALLLLESSAEHDLAAHHLRQVIAINPSHAQALQALSTLQTSE